MRDAKLLCAGVLLNLLMMSAAIAQTNLAPIKPLTLSLDSAEPESVYEPPSPARGDEGINEGAVHFDLGVGYFTDYVYRGIEIFEPPGAEDRPNLQIASKLSFDLGKLPHPFVGVFVNYADSDPISTFQEIRPSFGAEWTIRPLILTAGHNTYLYPDRDAFETAEVFGKIEIDDSYFLHTEKPILSPYIYAAYDYDRYNGWYIEAGVNHDFVVEDTGLTLTAQASVAYISGFQLFETTAGQKNVNGFQHYQLGLIANYSLNTLFNFSTRFGEWSLQGFLYYTDGMKNDLRTDTQVWGGSGIMFKY